MPAARARHRRQLLLLRQRPPDHRAATRTRRPARRASAGLDVLPRLATSPPAAMPRRSQIAASIKSRDAQDPVPILVTGRLKAFVPREGWVRTAGLLIQAITSSASFVTC